MKMTSVRVFLHVVRQVAQGADELGVGLHAEAVAAAVVEETGHFHAHAGIVGQAPRQLQAAVVVAGKDGAAVVERVHHEAVHDLLHDQRHADQRHRSDHRPGEEYAPRVSRKGLGDIADGQQHRQQQQPAEDHIGDGG